MRRQKHAAPTQLLTGGDLMRFVSLGSSMIIIFFVVYSLYRNPRFFDGAFGGGRDPVPAIAAAPQASPPPIVNNQRPNADKCREVDRKLLESVRDKTDTDPNDNPAIFQLMCVASAKAKEDLAKESRKDVQLANYYASPKLLRGQLIHLSGVLTRLVLLEPPPGTNPFGADRFYEGWIFTDNQSDIPSVVLFSDLPAGLAPGDMLKENVSLDAYFLKLLRYASRDGKGRYSPMFVAHTLVLPPKLDLESAGVEATVVAGGFVLVIAAVSGFLLLRMRRDEQTTQRIRDNMAPPAPTGPPVFVDDTPKND